MPNGLQLRCPLIGDLHADVNQQWAEWATSFEESLQGHLPNAPGPWASAPSEGQAPANTADTAENLSTSAQTQPDQVKLFFEMTSLAVNVRHWFRQLRRLQSYVAAVRAGKQTPAALAYRLELWAAVLRSPGFKQGFSVWWRHHRASRPA